MERKINTNSSPASFNPSTNLEAGVARESQASGPRARGDLGSSPSLAHNTEGSQRRTSHVQVSSAVDTSLSPTQQLINRIDAHLMSRQRIDGKVFYFKDAKHVLSNDAVFRNSLVNRHTPKSTLLCIDEMLSFLDDPAMNAEAFHYLLGKYMQLTETRLVMSGLDVGSLEHLFLQLKCIQMSLRVLTPQSIIFTFENFERHKDNPILCDFIHADDERLKSLAKRMLPEWEKKLAGTRSMNAMKESPLGKKLLHQNPVTQYEWVIKSLLDISTFEKNSAAKTPQAMAATFSRTVEEPLRRLSEDFEASEDFISKKMEEIRKANAPLVEYPSCEKRDMLLKLEALRLSHQLKKALVKESIGLHTELTHEQKKKLDTILVECGIKDHFDTTKASQDFFNHSQFILLKLASDANLHPYVRLKCLKHVNIDLTKNDLNHQAFFVFDDTATGDRFKQTDAALWHVLQDFGAPDVLKLQARRFLVCSMSQTLMHSVGLSAYDRLEAVYASCQSHRDMAELRKDKSHPIHDSMKHQIDYSAEDILRFFKEYNCRLRLILNEGRVDISFVSQGKLLGDQPIMKAPADTYFFGHFFSKLVQANNEDAILELLNFLDCEDGSVRSDELPVDKEFQIKKKFLSDVCHFSFSGRCLNVFDAQANQPTIHRIREYAKDTTISAESRLKYYIPKYVEPLKSKMLKLQSEFEYINVYIGLLKNVTQDPSALTLDCYHSLKASIKTIVGELGRVHSRMERDERYNKHHEFGNLTQEMVMQKIRDADAIETDYLIQLYSSPQVSATLKKQFSDSGYTITENHIEKLSSTSPEGPERLRFLSAFIQKDNQNLKIVAAVISHIIQYKGLKESEKTSFKMQGVDMDAIYESAQQKLDELVSELIFNPEWEDYELTKSCLDMLDLEDKSGYLNFIEEKFPNAGIASANSEPVSGVSVSMSQPVATPVVATPVPQAAVLPVGQDIQDLTIDSDFFSSFKILLAKRGLQKQRLNNAEAEMLRAKIQRAKKGDLIDEGVEKHMNGKINGLTI